jgi:hypothetical protein
MGMTGDDVTPAVAFRELVQGLVDANLERDPARALRLSKREAASLVAIDADVAVTIQMLPGARRAPGSVLIHDGRDPWAEIVVRAESLGLLELAATPLRFDLPDVMTRDGRTVVGQLLRGRIKVTGMFRHLGTVRRLSMLLSAR